MFNKFIKMKKSHIIGLLSIAFILMTFLASCSGYKGPEDLPKYKKKFKAQISGFEAQKEKTSEKIEDGVTRLGTIQEALANAADTDKEFKRVYDQWNKVDRNVKGLFKEYEDLRNDADNLFSAMESQTEGLNDANMRNDLRQALSKSRGEYEVTLANTEKAINKLRGVYDEAIDIIKGLEVAIALGQISQITDGLKSIESRIPNIMAELNRTVEDSKELYEQRMGGVGGA